MELFNDSHFSTHQVRDDALFHPFPRLPLELRWCIWRHYLRRSRFIPIRISPIRTSPGPNPVDYSAKNGLGKIISGRCRFYVCYYGSSLSPLLRVSSEARKAALDFYRVHLPLSYSPPPHRQDEPPPCLYVNPEHDVLAPIEFPDDGVRHWRPWNLANFLHDVKAYDPKDVGVVQLALRPNSSFFHRPEDHRFPSGGLLPKDEFRQKLLRAIDPQAAAALHDMLENSLSSVFFLKHIPLDYYSTRVLMPSDTSRPFAARFLRGFPLRRHLEAVTDFDWLEADPRPVETDLKGLASYGGGDPGGCHDGWLHVEEALGVRRQRPVDFLICPAVNWRVTSPEDIPEPSGQAAGKQPWRAKQPHTRDGLARFLAHEQEEWDKAGDWVEKERLRLQGLGRLPGDLPRQETAEGLESEAQSVVGAWVLPRSAGGGALAKYDSSAGRPGLIVFKYAVA
ncbi:hypothetical protein MAPG_08585 [Magnaporthiopsis poae ATCC 64411]|uniref:2EXR domain-containing protein n=1 Tax=Magnaporthiopsis poae (strain ATCC 64411 / 73-15) TaxID=644358 RepID=A0A0C4E7R5_MAGP6|nr:hypothetical protein MAPG_08585 [Magnaporthiopsis poae ATCC 64411]